MTHSKVSSFWDTEGNRKELAERVRREDETLDDSDLEYMTEQTLSRYLQARKGDVAAAAKILHSTLVWRKGMHLDTLSTSEFDKELALGRMYVAQDSSGKSILITRKNKDQPMGRTAAEYEHYMRFLAFTLETCVRTMSPSEHQWVWILDMGAYSRANSPPHSVSLATLRVLADHYPERLHMSVFVDAPSVFSWLWAVLSPFLDPVTRKKIMFVKSSDLPASVWEQAGQTPPVSAAPSDKQHSAAVQSFLPYAHHWAKPFSESDYRKLLAQVGWPETAKPRTQEASTSDTSAQ